MEDIAKTCANSLIEKLNLFKFLQIVWLIEFHLLAIFSGIEAIEHIFKISIKMPSIITEYGTKILDWMTEYKCYTLSMSIVAFIVGFAGWCFTRILFLSKYDLVRAYSDFGLYAGRWLLLIFLTYKLYTSLGALFLITPFLALIIYKIALLLKAKMREIMEYYNISFRTWE